VFGRLGTSSAEESAGHHPADDRRDTFAIGLLPTHRDIGVAAAVLLVVLRFSQGVGLGGEWGGAVLLSSEFGDPARRGFWASAARSARPWARCWRTV